MSNPIKHRVYVWSMTTDRLYAWGTDRVDLEKPETWLLGNYEPVLDENGEQVYDEDGDPVERLAPITHPDGAPVESLGGSITLRFNGIPIPTDNPAHRLAMAVLMGDMDAARILADAVLMGDITST